MKRNIKAPITDAEVFAGMIVMILVALVGWGADWWGKGVLLVTTLWPFALAVLVVVMRLAGGVKR